jgi:lipopolysaccharide export system protein LptA
VQGTLTIRAEKLVVTQDADGFSHGVATVPAGVPAAALASFREKRDGADEYVEGWGERIEYDARADKAELFVRARLKRNQDEVRGNYISYNGKTEIYLVNSGEPGAASAKPTPDRVHVTLMPKAKDAAKDGAKGAAGAAKPDSGLELTPAGAIAKPRED